MSCAWDFLMTIPSCSDAIVAMTAVTVIGIMEWNENGTAMYNSSPVALLSVVCGKTHFLYLANEYNWLMDLMAAIKPPHIHNQDGSLSAGISIQTQQATKTRSAILSNNAPVLLAASSLRANSPSAMSLMPQNRYKAQNAGLGTSLNKMQAAPAIRSAVIRLGRCLILMLYTLDCLLQQFQELRGVCPVHLYMMELKRNGQAGLKQPFAVFAPHHHWVAPVAGVLVDDAVEFGLDHGRGTDHHIFGEHHALALFGSLGGQLRVIAAELVQVFIHGDVARVDAALFVSHNHIDSQSVISVQPPVFGQCIELLDLACGPADAPA